MNSRQLFAQSIYPAPSLIPFDEQAMIFGLDSEFRQEDQKLVCWQLSYHGKAELYEPPMTWARLRAEAEKLSGARLKSGKVFYFSTFFSTAEAQHLPRTRTRFDQFYAGSYDITHYVDRYRRLKIVDMAQWFAKQKLSEACRLFGLKKLDYDVSHVTEKLLKDRKFREYALNDARIHRELFIRLRSHVWRLFSVDILRYRTAAAASLRHFRQSYVTQKISNSCQTLRAQALSTKHGGAIMNYYRGELSGQFFCYDAFSQYPQAVLSLGVLPRSHDWKQATGIDDALDAQGGLLHVLFEFPAGLRYPCMVVKTATGNYFPLSGDSFCTVPEARLARQMGARLHLIKGYVYDEGTDELYRYMKRLLTLRRRAKGTEENYLYKKFMNSLLGKFGQSYQKTSLGEIEVAAASRGMTVEEFCGIAGYAESVCSTSLHLGAGYVPEWYALITGAARASVLEAAWKNEALAVVVDSVLTARPMERLVYGNIAYALKEQGTRYVAYREMFYGLFDDAGIPVKLSHQGSPENGTIRAALASFQPDLKELEYERKRILKLSESQRRGRRFGATVYEQHHKPLYNPRGILSPTGEGWISPFALAPR